MSNSGNLANILEMVYLKDGKKLKPRSVQAGDRRLILEYIMRL